MSDTNQNDIIFSDHVFLYPFRWDVGNNQEIRSASFQNRINRGEFVKLLDKRWQQTKYYEKNPIAYYNSANYFYEFVRQGIFSFNGEDSTVLNFSLNKNNKEYLYVIERLMQDDSIKVYELSVYHIGLNVYDTGIGIISFHLHNKDRENKKLEDILAINDFGRRMYPQFLDTSISYDSTIVNQLIKATQLAFLPKSIKIFNKDEDTDVLFKEEFTEFTKSEDLRKLIKKNPIKLPNSPKNIAPFLGKEIGTSESSDMSIKAVIRPILDDRNFVLSWYADDVEINLLNWNSKNNEYGFLNHQKCNNWLRYVFVDNSGNSIQNKLERIQYSQKHTYSRWIDYGTLYGISRYSLVCLSTDSEFSKNVLRTQVCGGVYFEMAQLLLAQRASILRFSDEATSLSINKIVYNSSKYLHEQYMKFVNKLYFREATPQEQGIEMYKMLSEFMEIERDVDNLNREIDELHQFVAMEAQNDQNNKATELNKIASIFLPASLLASVLTFFSDKEFDLNKKFDTFSFIILLGFVLIVLLSLYFYKPINECIYNLGKKKNKTP